MNKLEQAARQALEALREYRDTQMISAPRKAIEALREVLGHSADAGNMVVGWDRVKPEAIASDPLYQQGFVDGVEEGRNQGAEQAEQEPVAIIEKEAGFETEVYATGHAASLPDGVFKLYASPVRIKDLTDDEILSIPYLGTGELKTSMVNFARAVIAADREKNNANNNS